MQAVPTDYRHVLFMKRAISTLLAARPGQQRHLTFYQLKNSVFATLSGVVTFKKYKMICRKISFLKPIHVFENHRSVHQNSPVHTTRKFLT